MLNGRWLDRPGLFRFGLIRAWLDCRRFGSRHGSRWDDRFQSVRHRAAESPGDKRCQLVNLARWIFPILVGEQLIRRSARLLLKPFEQGLVSDDLIDAVFLCRQFDRRGRAVFQDQRHRDERDGREDPARRDAVARRKCARREAQHRKSDAQDVNACILLVGFCVLGNGAQLRKDRHLIEPGSIGGRFCGIAVLRFRNNFRPGVLLRGTGVPPVRLRQEHGRDARATVVFNFALTSRIGCD